MARRSDHSREEIRQMALEAAERIVEQDGLKGLSARKVAAAIGYTVGTLYLVFKNLDDLICTVNGRTLDQLHRTMADSQNGCGSPESCLIALGNAYIRFAIEHNNRWAMLYEYSSPEGWELPEWYYDKVARMFSLVREALAPLAAHHSERKIAAAAQALWGGVHGISVLEATDKLGISGGDSAEALADILIKNFLKGFSNNQ